MKSFLHSNEKSEKISDIFCGGLEFKPSHEGGEVAEPIYGVTIYLCGDSARMIEIFVCELEDAVRIDYDLFDDVLIEPFGLVSRNLEAGSYVLESE